MPELSVVVPMYNEGEAVEENISRFVEAMEKLDVDWELLPVDDGSTDDTHDQLKKLQAGDDRIQFVSYTQNRGRGYALRSGIAASRGKYVVTTEADMSYGSAIIGRLYNALVEKAVDVIIASPYMPGGKLENVPFKRAMLSRCANRLLRSAVTPAISTVSGMTRGYLGESIRSIPLEEDGKEIHLEIVSKASVLGCTFDEIPATLAWRFSQERTKRASKLGWKTVGHIISHLLFGFSESPFMLFGTVGLVLLLGGLIMGAGLLYDYAICGEIIGDRMVTILTCIFLLITGFLSFLMYFLSHQNRELKRDLLKVRQDIRQMNIARKSE